MCKELDKIWTKELLSKFLKKYNQVPMIIENRSSYSFDDEMETIDLVNLL